jgi:hypothetical protein
MEIKALDDKEVKDFVLVALSTFSICSNEKIIKDSLNRVIEEINNNG